MASNPSPCPTCNPPAPTEEEELRANLAGNGLLPHNDAPPMEGPAMRLAQQDVIDVAVHRHGSLLREHLDAVASFQVFREQEDARWRADQEKLRQHRMALRFLRDNYDLDQVALDVIAFVLGADG